MTTSWPANSTYSTRIGVRPFFRMTGTSFTRLPTGPMPLISAMRSPPTYKAPKSSQSKVKVYLPSTGASNWAVQTMAKASFWPDWATSITPVLKSSISAGLSVEKSGRVFHSPLYIVPTRFLSAVLAGGNGWALSSSSAVHGVVRLAVAARTDFTSSMETGPAPLAKLLRIYVSTAAIFSSLRTAPWGGMSMA